MNNKSIVYIIVAIILLALLAFVLFYSSDDDRWVCEDGVWIAIGEPTEPRPTTTCPADFNENQNLNNNQNTNNNNANGNLNTNTNGNINLNNNLNINNSAQIDLRLTSIASNKEVSSPLIVEGEARGSWFFEAEFPVILEDANGEVIAQGSAMTEDDWMTTDFVDYSVTLNFDQPETATGRLILKKANASGLPENDDEVIIPVRFE